MVPSKVHRPFSSSGDWDVHRGYGLLTHGDMIGARYDDGTPEVRLARQAEFGPQRHEVNFERRPAVSKTRVQASSGPFG